MVLTVAQPTSRPGARSRRVALVTGAGGTLGSAFCRRYAADYDIVAVCGDRLPGSASRHDVCIDPLNNKLTIPSGAIHTVYADLRDDGEIVRVVRDALAEFGGIDLLVNAAATSIWSPILGSAALIESLGPMFRLNVEVPVRLAAEIVRTHWAHDGPENRARNRNIVNISSTAGIYIIENSGQSGYSASKAALNNLTLHMANEFAAIGIRVNALAPDSFPERVSVESVCDWIVEFDRMDLTGRILVLDKGRLELI